MAEGGQILNGRYRLVHTLGIGGMGSVWLAEDVVLRRRVALKELRRCHVDPRELETRRKRVMNEARALARVKHPAVVGIHDVFREGDDPWIVMEYVDAASLDDVVERDGPFDERRIARIGRRVLGALNAAHRASVLHRDVKPSNILLTNDDRVSLVDFGVAQVAGATRVTSANTVVGTAEFMAPERIAGRESGPAADLWSLGVVLFFGLEGYSPFQRKGDDRFVATMSAILNDPLPRFTRPGRLADIVAALLRKEPSVRMNARELDGALRSILTRRTADRGEREPKGPVGHDRGDERRGPPGAGEPRGPAAGRTARGPAGSPIRIHESLTSKGPATAGRILLDLPPDEAMRVLTAGEARTAAGWLDGIATDPSAAEPIVRLLPADFLARALRHMTAGGAAALLAAVPPDVVVEILARTGHTRTMAGVVDALPLAAAVRQIEAMSVRRACDVLNQVPPVTTAALLRASSDGRAGRLLAGLDRTVRTQVRRHL